MSTTTNTNTPFQALNLRKDETINLRKEGQTLSRIAVAAGWDIAEGAQSNHSFDLDLSLFMLTGGKLESSNDIVYFGRKVAMGIEHMGDNLTGAGEGDDETINMDLRALETRVDECVFVINIYEAHNRNQKFSDVKNAFIRVYNLENNEELCRFELSGNTHTTNALIFGSVCRTADNWMFKATEQPVNGDLNTIASLFRK
jgi:tellurium resistance protein TerD